MKGGARRWAEKVQKCQRMRILTTSLPSEYQASVSSLQPGRPGLKPPLPAVTLPGLSQTQGRGAKGFLCCSNCGHLFLWYPCVHSVNLRMPEKPFSFCKNIFKKLHLMNIEAHRWNVRLASSRRGSLITPPIVAQGAELSTVG